MSTEVPKHVVHCSATLGMLLLVNTITRTRVDDSRMRMNSILHPWDDSAAYELVTAVSLGVSARFLQKYLDYLSTKQHFLWVSHGKGNIKYAVWYVTDGLSTRWSLRGLKTARQQYLLLELRRLLRASSRRLCVELKIPTALEALELSQTKWKELLEKV